jgi:hypothetical protein
MPRDGTKRRIPALLAIPILATVAGCAGFGPGVEVVHSTPSVPIVPGAVFTVLPTSYEGATVEEKTLPRYLAALDATHTANWTTAQAAFESSFGETLLDSSAGRWRFRLSRGAIPAGEFGVRVRIIDVARDLSACKVLGRVSILAANGESVDEIDVAAGAPGYSSRESLKSAGKSLAKAFVKYIDERGEASRR